VIPRTRLPAELLRLSQAQAGVLSRQQAQGLGLSDRVVERLIQNGDWQRVAAGIYRLEPETWLQLAWAGVLLGGQGSAIGGRSAAHLHGWLKQPPSPVTIFTYNDFRIRRDPRWQFVRSGRIGRGEPARTRPAQTIIDLAATSTAEELITLLAEATAFGRVNPAEVLQLAGNIARLPNRRLLQDTLGMVAEGAQSPLETRYLTTVERAHRLPKALRQASPAHRYRTDCWYRDYGVIVELDGAAYHRGAARTIDLERDNLHRINDLITLRFNWQLVTSDPCGVALQVAAALRHRGWQGSPSRCSRCKAVHFPP
jgi:very-short-patch-repair endonuclease